jgi:hypothetical protein
MRSTVFEHAPHHDDITVFVGRFTTAVDARDLARTGSTPDGAALSPEPLRTVFGEVPHQRGTFQGITDLTHGVLQAVATARDRLAASTPT